MYDTPAVVRDAGGAARAMARAVAAPAAPLRVPRPLTLRQLPQQQRGQRRPLRLHEQCAAGGVAGVTELCFMYPLDVVKTRMQVATAGRRVGLAGELLAIAAHERHRVYRGIFFPLLVEFPKIASKFAAYGACSRALGTQQAGSDGRHGAARHLGTYTTALASGAAAGFVEGTVVCAPEVVKIRMQLPENAGRYATSLACATAIARYEGIRGLFRGQCATWARNAVWNTCYFPATLAVKNVRASRGWCPSAPETFVSFMCGAIGGVLGTFCNCPLDVVKTRIQTDAARLHMATTAHDVHAAAHLRALPTTTPAYMRYIVHTEGVFGLWKGFGPKLLRMGPGGGLLIVVFETVADWLART